MNIIQHIIEASGGEVWRRPKTLQLSGKGHFTPFGKTGSEALFFDTYEMKRIFPTQNLAAHEANGKVRFDAFYGEHLFFQLKFNGKDSNINLADVAKPYAEYFKWSNNFGFGILRFADQDTFSVERLVDDQIEGHPCYFIKNTDPQDNVTFFAADQATYFLRMVGFSTGLGWHHRIYSDFQPDTTGFVQPMRVRIYFDGIKWVDIDWESVQVNEPIPEEWFN